MKCTPTDFSAGYTVSTNTEILNTGQANPLESLDCIRILYAGSTYPTPDYNLQFGNYNVNSNFEAYTQYQSNDLYRALYDFLTNSDAHYIILKLGS